MKRRNRYDDPYQDRQQFERAVLRPDWGRGHPTDPNWRDGHYHGMRSEGGRWQGSYGRYRLAHREDVRGAGGFEGRYGRPAGGFDEHGILRMEGRRESDRLPRRDWRYDDAFRDAGPDWQGGGVREDMGYLRQYNTRSPELRHPGQRGFGWAERAHYGNLYRDEGPTREREYGGYNRGGWAAGSWPGPGSRGSLPNR
jgi:hypothetical protein